MTDIPILFSAPMVRALLEGRKTMTRRLAWKSEPVWCEGGVIRDASGGQEDYIEPHFLTQGKPSRWQRVTPGDRLWVRESLDLRGDRPDLPIWRASYRADGAPLDLSVPANLAFAEGKSGQRRGRFINSIHMPRSFSRITLIVETVKIERLQDISEDDAKAEGCKAFGPLPGGDHSVPTGGAADAFGMLWSSLHGSESWNANPEVVAISFRVIKSNIDSAEARAAQF